VCWTWLYSRHNPWKMSIAQCGWTTNCHDRNTETQHGECCAAAEEDPCSKKKFICCLMCTSKWWAFYTWHWDWRTHLAIELFKRFIVVQQFVSFILARTAR
jgi:hypothetical protein